MKVDIIKSFKGSPDGRFAVQYNAGDKDVEMTDSLYKTASAEGWVKPAKSEKKNKGAVKSKNGVDDDIANAEAAAKLKEEIDSLASEILSLEDAGKIALEKDPSGETANPIQAEWEEKQKLLEEKQEALADLLK